MADLLEFDECKMYFGIPYKINDYVTITPPTVGQIIEWGENKYFSMVHLLTAIPSDMKSHLFDLGVDYEEISDFDFFIYLCKNISKEQTSIILGDLDLSQLIPLTNEETGKVSLYTPIFSDGKNVSVEICIDELAYVKLSNYLRKLHGITSKVEHAANKTTKRILIELDRQKKAELSKDPQKSNLFPVISARMRYPGFKYKSNELKECGIYEFIDTVKGANIYIQSTSLLAGSFSGFMDTSKIPKKNFDWMRAAE